MENLEVHVEDDVLTIRVDLRKEVGLSNSARSIIVASSQGNLRLIDARGYREEKLNLTVSKSLPKTADEMKWPDETVTTATADTQSATESDNAQ
ncbi:MAG: hypothetical protein ACLQPD_12940 [Desulfomonilaceae bacterium]